MLFKHIAIRHRHIHFVGIGGIGMSGLAEILLSLGYEISGSDLRRSTTAERLGSLGVRIFEGHRQENIAGADAVVVSSAIPNDNPERVAASKAQVPIIERGELLAELMRLQYGIAIAGSHGKTTTTSITASVLNAAGLDPTVVVGGRVDALGSNARLGSSDLLLVEADESDGSFLRLAPIVAVVTSIDAEHLDHYGSLKALQEAFVAFANKVPFYGSVILCLDDPPVREILPRVKRRVRSYGMAGDADLTASAVESAHLMSRFELRYRGDDLGRFQVRGAGRHDVLNAMAAVLTGLELEAPLESIREGLAAFSGVDRRFQVRGVKGRVTVVDDYGHHPTEIRATLAAARSCEFAKVHVIFQPHRYSRTALLFHELGSCFEDCDRLYVVDIYGAGEEPVPGVDAARLTEEIRASGHPCAAYFSSMDSACEAAAEAARPGDVVITLGAGSIGRVGEQLLSLPAEGVEKQETSPEGL